MQVLAVRPALPADALVPAGQIAGREVEQQAAQQTPLAVAQEVAQVRAQRLAVAEVVVALDRCGRTPVTRRPPRRSGRAR